MFCLWLDVWPCNLHDVLVGSVNIAFEMEMFCKVTAHLLPVTDLKEIVFIQPSFLVLVSVRN